MLSRYKNVQRNMKNGRQQGFICRGGNDEYISIPEDPDNTDYQEIKRLESEGTIVITDRQV